MSIVPHKKIQSSFEKRTKFTIELRTELRITKQKIKRFELTIENLSKSSGNDIEWITSQLEHYRNRISETQIIVLSLQSKIDGVAEGNSDAEIEVMYKILQDKTVDFEEKRSKQSAASAALKLDQYEVGDAYGKSEYKNMRNERYILKQCEKEHDRMMDVASQLPEYISKNLESTPCNKGYRWRGVIFFGKAPYENNGTTVIFEKRPGGTNIQEYTPTLFTECSKARESPKQFIRSYKRKVTLRGPARLIMD